MLLAVLGVQKSVLRFVEKDLKNFKDSPLTHKNYKESVEQEIETYYKSRKLQLGSIEKKIQNIERKYV